MISNDNNSTYNQSISLTQIQNITNMTNNINSILSYDFIQNFPIFSCVQSFLLAFCTLLSDQSYILLIVIKKKFSKSTLIFFSFTFSVLLLNAIIVLIGKLFGLILYRNLIEFVSSIIFGFIGIIYFFKFFYRQKRKSYNQEIKYILTPMPKLGIDFSTNRSRKSSKILVFDKNDDFIFKHYYEVHNKIFLFYIFGKKIFRSVLGSIYTYIIFVDSALSDFFGVITGSSLAILIVVYLGCYQANCIGGMLSEAKTGSIVSFICLTTAAEIYIFSAYFGI